MNTYVKRVCTSVSFMLNLEEYDFSVAGVWP